MNDKIAYLTELRHLMESHALVTKAKAEYLARIERTCDWIERDLFEIDTEEE